MTTYAKSIELSAESPVSFEQAVKDGVAKMHESVRHIRSVWIKSQEVELNEDASIKGWRVHLVATFGLE